MKNGIAIAGNIICDVIKTVDAYPACGMLANISGISKSVGGCVPNTAVNLVSLGGVKVKALGKTGNDTEGEYVKREMSRAGVDVSRVTACAAPTSFTDVITVPGGERTFFYASGAGAEFGPKDINLKALSCEILHLGYLMLLDAFDAADGGYGTVAARFLSAAREAGIKTSIDTVSQSGGAFRQALVPALKFCDYAIINEIEAGEIAGIPPRDKDGKLLVKNIENILRALIEHGVREKAVIHCPEGGFCLDIKKGRAFVPSLRLPKGYIKGKVGAGDAFCAGVLFGIYNGFTDEETLKAASCVAARNLAFNDSVSGACALEEALKLEKLYSRG